MQLQPRRQLGRSALLIALGALLAIACGKSGESRPAHDDAHPADPAQQRGEQMVAFAKQCHEVDLKIQLAPCKSACDLNHSNSCARMGEHYRLNGRLDEARRWFEHACKGGSGVGCQGAAELASDADKPAWYKKARQYHRVHCEQDYLPSCLALAKLHEYGLGGPVDKGVAAHYLERACGLGAEQACK